MLQLIRWITNCLRRMGWFPYIATSGGHKTAPLRHPNTVSIIDQGSWMLYFEIYHCVCVEAKVSAVGIER